jgi:hypothetical protein
MCTLTPVSSTGQVRRDFAIDSENGIDGLCIKSAILGQALIGNPGMRLNLIIWIPVFTGMTNFDAKLYR